MDPARAIEQLRATRARRQFDHSITSIIAGTQKNAMRTHRRLGEFIDLWERTVPPRLAAQTTVTGIRAGTAHVLVESSAALYELDRLLREGVEQTLRSQYRGTLIRVRLRIGPGDEPKTAKRP
jgi:hypothetical protein